MLMKLRKNADLSPAYDKHQTAKQSAEDVAHFCHVCQVLEQMSSKLPAGFAYSKRLGKGKTPFFQTKKSAKSWANTFFWRGFLSIFEGLGPWMIFFVFWVALARLFDLQPGKPGNCPSGLPSDFG